MQILPLVTSSSQPDADGTQQSVAASPSARFASLLAKARTATAAGNGQTAAAQADVGKTGSLQTASALSSDPLEAANAPSQQDLMQLLMTREDLADLHGDLVNQGFSEDEITALGEKIDSPTGMTWGEMMGAVKKKIAKTTSTEKKAVSNDDTVQLLGLFGKLGFTADQSQKMVDALANGQTDSVLAAVDAKVANLAADDTVSLTSSEISTLGGVMNLSEAAQKRLTALFDHSDAASGLSGQGLATAFGLVKNEIVAQIGQENQSMAQFRQAASLVLDKAWQRQQGKINSDLHQDDVARKAAQVVAMGGEKNPKTSVVPTASQPGIDVLADVPEPGRSSLADAGVTAPAAGASGNTTRSAATADRQAVRTAQAQGANAAVQAGGSELEGRAGGVAVEQAAAWEQAGQESVDGAQGLHRKVATQTAQTAETASAQKPNAVAAVSAGGDAGESASGQRDGGALGRGGQDGGLETLAGKAHQEKTSDRSSTTKLSDIFQGLGVTDATGAGHDASAAKVADPVLAARVARQLEGGILRSIGQDARQLTVTLTPEELGPLDVTLTVKDKEIRAVIKADNPDTAAMLNDQAAQIKKTLEDQGFKVTKFDVQSGIAQDNQSAWQSPEQHNQAREQREAMDRMRTSQRLAREGSLSLDADSLRFTPQAASAGSDRLDLFA